MADANGLTLKQRRFVDAYLGEANGNGTAAARTAGYKHPSEDAYENLRKPQIRAYIDARLEAECPMAGAVLREVSAVAMAEWQDYITLKYGRGGEVIDVKMDLSAKVKALELLGKYYRLWPEGKSSIVLTGTDGGPVKVQVEHVNSDPERASLVFGILAEIGATRDATALLRGADPTVDELYSASTDAAADRVSVADVP